MDLQISHRILSKQIDTIEEFCKTGSPLVFVLEAAFLDYLSKLASGGEWGGPPYKKFVTDWMSRVRPEYRSFRYRCNKRDLPTQMYHTLRCGIVHSFSLTPDNPPEHGREGSIILLHRDESETERIPHLSNYPRSNQVPDAAAFVAEDFAEDIRVVTDELFAQAESNPKLRANLEKQLCKRPLIAWVDVKPGGRWRMDQQSRLLRDGAVPVPAKTKTDA